MSLFKLFTIWPQGDFGSLIMHKWGYNFLAGYKQNTFIKMKKLKIVFCQIKTSSLTEYSFQFCCCCCCCVIEII